MQCTPVTKQHEKESNHVNHYSINKHMMIKTQCRAHKQNLAFSLSIHDIQCTQTYDTSYIALVFSVKYFIQKIFQPARAIFFYVVEIFLEIMLYLLLLLQMN